MLALLMTQNFAYSLLYLYYFIDIFRNSFSFQFERLNGLRRIVLVTSDAHGVFAHLVSKS